MEEIEKILEEMETSTQESEWRKEEKEGKFGQYFTPSSVAQQMMKEISKRPTWKGKKEIKVLDPACGKGILSAALCLHLLREGSFGGRTWVFLMYEVDPSLTPSASQFMLRIQRAARKEGLLVKFQVLCRDFVLEAVRKDVGKHDLVVANPPYFKLRADSEQVKATKGIVEGQGNIYSLFMALCARLLQIEGTLIFLVPRSFASGKYFEKFRLEFFQMVSLKAVHLFDSRFDFDSHLSSPLPN